MGVQKCLYLGPYVECTYKPSTRVEHVRGCTNKECKKHPRKRGPDAEGNFCSTCASPNGPIPFEVKDRPDHVEVTDEKLFKINSDDDENDKYLWLAPNVIREGAPRPDVDDDREIHLDLAAAKPEDEIAWFKDAFAKELWKLEAAYATVTVKWGLHQYFM
jgi:hypothetical protein